MKKTLISAASLALVLSCGLTSCGEKKSAETENESAKTATLTYSTERMGEQTAQAEFPVDDEGYTVIFDGTDFTGWRGYGKDHVPERWSVEDSCMHFVRGEGEGGDIMFGHKFQDFDIQFEWKVSEGANSGFFYLGMETVDPEGNLEYMCMSAPEYQILDNANHPDAKLGIDGNRQSASLYDMIPAKPQNSKPWGEWNTARVTVKDGKVAHYQNGEKVLEYEIWTPEWTDRLQACKFSETEWPAAFNYLNNKHDGHFAFQDHGDEIWIRNVRVKEL
ncbi:MAG: DUF1080 domain-containing protein [Muribaculaceae bacterium]|nr:DUF1080 domain-containing protein [Muribaculaceae bacterium]MDE7458361.1 DUF1080 domain-containing protein [Muribaculaceae bacterium]